MSAPHREVEAKLVAPGEAAAARAAAALEGQRIGGVVLGRSELRRFRDRYFDSAAGALARGRVALRLRDTGAISTLTLKGRAEEVSGGLARLEIEGEWGPSVLAALGPHLPLPGVSFDPDPGRALARAGLMVIQDRWAERRQREAVWAGSPCAEIALDRVDFEVEGGLVHLAEVEIELLPGVERGLLPALVEALRAAVPELTPWRHSKLASGLAVAALAAEGWIGPGWLGGAELDRVAAWIAASLPG